jgi:hypothetical protein
MSDINDKCSQKRDKIKNTPTLKFRTLSFMSLLTLFKTCKGQLFVKLEFKLLFLSKTVSPIQLVG